MERAAWVILLIAVVIAFGAPESKAPAPAPQPLPPMSPEECPRFGLDKLTAKERQDLGERLGQTLSCSGDDPPIPPLTGDVVMFNTKSHKYHCPSCRHVAGCRNCVPMPRAEAKARGRACGNCGGCDP